MKETFFGNGKNNILIISGVHGNERTPLVVTKAILKEPSKFSNNYNKLTILHAVNEKAIQSGSRQVDNIDLNREFHLEDEFNENPLVDLIKEEIDQTDIIIDIHSSPSCVELLAIDQNIYSKSFCDFANELNIPYIIQKPNIGSIKSYCLLLDKPCFTFEVNKLDTIDLDSAKKGFYLIKKIIDQLDILNFEPSEDIPVENKKVYTKDNCLILPTVNIGDIIKPNQVFGFKINSDGNVVELKSQEEKDCMVLTTAYQDYKDEEDVISANQIKNNSLFTLL